MVPQAKGGGAVAQAKTVWVWPAIGGYFFGRVYALYLACLILQGIGLCGALPPSFFMHTHRFFHSYLPFFFARAYRLYFSAILHFSKSQFGFIKSQFDLLKSWFGLNKSWFGFFKPNHDLKIQSRDIKFPGRVGCKNRQLSIKI